MAEKSFVVHYVLPTVVIGVIAGYAIKSRKETPPRDVVRNEEPAPKPVQAGPVYVEPKTDSPHEAVLDNTAMHVVYGRCSVVSPVFRAATYDATYVFRSDGEPERVNVSVTPVDKSTTNGHVLWYMVTFDDKGVASKIRATKDVAAQQCGLQASDVDVPIVE